MITKDTKNIRNLLAHRATHVVYIWFCVYVTAAACGTEYSGKGSTSDRMATN